MSFVLTLASSAANYLSSFITGASSSLPETDPFDPEDISISQLTTAHDILLRTSLPSELVLQILDYAEYWVREHHSREADLWASASGSGNGVHECTSLYTHTPPLCSRILDAPALLKPRRVRFTVVSRDQGWGGNPQDQGTYRGAFSWFDASILHEDAEFADDVTRREPMEGLMLSGIANYMPAMEHGFRQSASFFVGTSPESLMRIVRRNGYAARPRSNDDSEITWMLQRNQVAGRGFLEHDIEWNLDSDSESKTDEEWSEDGSGTGSGFVAALQRGDRISVWVRAQYPGWQNLVKSVHISVWYAL